MSKSHAKIQDIINFSWFNYKIDAQRAKTIAIYWQNVTINNYNQYTT